MYLTNLELDLWNRWFHSEVTRRGRRRRTWTVGYYSDLEPRRGPLVAKKSPKGGRRLVRWMRFLGPMVSIGSAGIQDVWKWMTDRKDSSVRSPHCWSLGRKDFAKRRALFNAIFVAPSPPTRGNGWPGDGSTSRLHVERQSSDHLVNSIE